MEEVMLERNISDTIPHKPTAFTIPIPNTTTPPPLYQQHYNPQHRRYLSSFGMIAVTIAVVFSSIVLWEMNAPYEYKISVRLGEFSGTTAAAALHAQQQARLEYEGKIKELEEIQQTNVAKQQTELQIELAKVNAEMQRIVGAYTTLYQRGNIIAQHMAQAQQQFLTLRNQMTANGQGGSVAAANLAGLVGGLVDVFGGQENKYLAEQFYNKADEINHRTRSNMDDTANVPAPFLKIQGWNNDIPSPNEFMHMTNDVATKVMQINEYNRISSPFARRSYEVNSSSR
jgi:hypothetical protein